MHVYGVRSEVSALRGLSQVELAGTEAASICDVPVADGNREGRATRRIVE